MSHQTAPAEVLFFWFGGAEERGKRHKRWFEKDPALDRAIAERFLGLYELAAAAHLEHWKDGAQECLALILVLDQFPRHLFRGSARAFGSDALALQAARHALARGYDRELLPVERLFLYLPFEHSESPDDQERACALTQELEAFPETADAYRYAVAHRDIIERFGRFPHRNAALGRQSTPEELDFLRQPGSSF